MCASQTGAMLHFEKKKNALDHTLKLSCKSTRTFKIGFPFHLLTVRRQMKFQTEHTGFHSIYISPSLFPIRDLSSGLYFWYTFRGDIRRPSLVLQ
jgi:hypothetical protein